MVSPASRRLSKSRALGIVGATVAILATSYYFYQKLTSASGDDDLRPLKDGSATKNKKARKSKCVIMSKSLQGLSIDWSEYVTDDVVLLVPMSQTEGSVREAIKQAFYSSGNEHKIILCDNMDGLWSCVRRLGKFQCILNSKDFSGAEGSDTAVVPEDIGRFVNFVVDSDIESVLIDTICN
ncbi:Pex22p [Saccharomyces cerevisiae x Saccharomyces kudriavzevii VIN7]|uniref:Peroxisome assembly protein 22 n=1 Tax=Saccharomyces cerevisiae x Saccharomyces kudriavzevii (strain VIN7) TaxID=1095631 RepID=H0GQR7_SACCK|nr:Pex22p [Saccharomyces cerevisiae x Saccharomyces kudriavzevii VIN7]